jgi:hypothetical protein
LKVLNLLGGTAQIKSYKEWGNAMSER